MLDRSLSRLIRIVCIIIVVCLVVFLMSCKVQQHRHAMKVCDNVPENVAEAQFEQFKANCTKKYRKRPHIKTIKCK